jgi:hypothetical protein
MKKKIIALTLVVGLIGTMTTTAFASSTVNNNSDAGIDFKWSGTEGPDGPTDPGIIDPENPGKVPEEEENFWKQFYTPDIEFGLFTATPAAIDAKSSEAGKTGAAYENNWLGIGVRTATDKQKWTLDAKMGAFLDGSTETLLGSTIELKNDLDAFKPIAGLTDAEKKAYRIGENMFIGGGHTLVLQKLQKNTTARVANGEWGVYGWNFDANLESEEDTANTPGNFQSVITWVFITQ